MNQGDTWLEEIATRMKREIENGTLSTPEQLTIREFLHKFGYGRRGNRIVISIRNRLGNYGLITNPDFAGGKIDSSMAISLDSGASEPVEAQYTSDPTHRIRSLAAADKKTEERKAG